MTDLLIDLSAPIGPNASTLNLDESNWSGRLENQEYSINIKHFQFYNS